LLTRLYCVGGSQNEEERVDPVEGANNGVIDFPEVVGMSKAEAKEFISGKNPGLNVQFMEPGTMWTRDYQENRIRVPVDADGKVNKQPSVG